MRSGYEKSPHHDAAEVASLGIALGTIVILAALVILLGIGL